MPHSRAEVVEKWIKVISTILLFATAGVVLYLPLTSVNSREQWFIGCMMLPIIFITIAVNFTKFAFDQEPSHVDQNDLEHLLTTKADWQHNHDANAWVSMGKFIGVGQCPDHLKSDSPASVISPLERLIAIKKQGYWLASSK